MPNSKTQKVTKSNKNICKYVYLRGKNQGQKCGLNCREEFCKRHKPGLIEYRKKYFKKAKEEKKQKIINERLELIKGIKSQKDLPDLRQEEMRLKELQSKATYLIKRFRGVQKVLGSYTDDDMNKDMEKYAERKDYDSIIHVSKSNILVEFIGTNKKAKEELKVLLKKRDTLVDKIKNQGKIIEEIQKLHEIFNQVSSDNMVKGLCDTPIQNTQRKRKISKKEGKPIIV